MSVITDNTSVSSIIQPSLVYPSLPRKKHNNNSYQPAPLFHRYRSIDAEDEVSSQDESVVVNNNNTKELQTCIHFASRLIKLRSELRSPSYMKTRTTSMQMQYSDYFQQKQQQQQQQQQHDYYEENRSTTTSSLSEVGRVQSLPNVSQLSKSDNEHPYSKKKFLDFCEDESEIISLNSNSTDEASQLTYLTELIRRGNSKKDSSVTSGGNLSLPPKHSSPPDYERKKKLSSTPSSTFKKNHRSLSLRDMIHEVIDEGIMNSKGDDKQIVQPIKRERFSSLALASQLLYASQSTGEKEIKEVDFYREKTEMNEGEVLLQLQQEKDLKEEQEENALSEKVEIQSRLLNSFNKQQDRLSLTSNSDEKKISTKTITPVAIIRQPPPLPPPPPIRKASLSSNTNKSLLSTLSSDSESEEEGSSHHSGSILFSSKRKINPNKRRPTAFLVSISPSSAAAATVAKSRRSQKRQQAVVMRTKLAEVYADKEKTI